MKIAILGCGLRTPLLIHGLAHSELANSRLVLYDIVPERASLMAELGRFIAAGTPLEVSTATAVHQAIEGCAFVISSIRPGGMEARARDERVTLECGFAGQETTGPAGFAMAHRTVPVALEHARLVERLAPDAWIINFTNPAGLITQAISVHTSARVVGICDTPAELFFRISLALERPLADVECDYVGLNHLGWVRAIRLNGSHDVTERVLQDDALLRGLYAAELFPPDMIRGLGLIPTEYLYFYYSQRTARANQLRAGATRGEELLTLNHLVFVELEANIQQGDPAAAVAAYRAYLNRRNASYMHLEGSGVSAFAGSDMEWNPFEGVTGYHRIAVEAIRALCAAEPARMVLNIPNRGAVPDLSPEDVVEIPCLVDKSGPRPISNTRFPEAVRGLAQAVKTYERYTIEAAVSHDRATAYLALFSNPIIGDWELARTCVERLLDAPTPDAGAPDH
jgi:6-phospho-beta-glucosidase